MAGVEGVVDVAAVLQDANSTEAAIVGYISPATASVDAALAACRAHLASYMVPTAIVALDKMPRLANGKVRRRRLTCCQDCSQGFHL